MAEIPVEVLKQLNAGTLATGNLVEWLAIDHYCLVETVCQQLDAAFLIAPAEAILRRQPQPPIMQRIAGVGQAWSAILQDHPERLRLQNALSRHNSDTMRSWAAYLIGCNPKLTLEAQLEQIVPFADDPHFGVREIAWLALRPAITEQLEQAITQLTPWTALDSAYLRRFACESIRPRGVWCKHIDRLKRQPELALPILQTLRADTSKYVQASVGNWLNDASKSKPAFVSHLCAQWRQESDVPATQAIIRRALRTLQKAG